MVNKDTALQTMFVPSGEAATKWDQKFVGSRVPLAFTLNQSKPHFRSVSRGS